MTEVLTRELCQHCDGTGMKTDKVACGACGHSGYKERWISIQKLAGMVKEENNPVFGPPDDNINPHYGGIEYLGNKQNET